MKRILLAVGAVAALSVTAAAPATATVVREPTCVSTLTAAVANIARTDAVGEPVSAAARDIAAECDLKVRAAGVTHTSLSGGTPPSGVVNGAHSAAGLYSNFVAAEMCAGVGGCNVWHSETELVFDSWTTAWNCAPAGAASCDDKSWQGLGWTNTYLDPYYVGGVGFTVTITDAYWAGSNPATYNELTGTGSPPLTATSTFTVSFLFHGFPVSDSHSFTISCWPSGAVGLTGA